MNGDKQDAKVDIFLRNGSSAELLSLVIKDDRASVELNFQEERCAARLKRNP